MEGLSVAPSSKPVVIQGSENEACQDLGRIHARSRLPRIESDPSNVM